MVHHRANRLHAACALVLLCGCGSVASSPSPEHDAGDAGFSHDNIDGSVADGSASDAATQGDADADAGSTTAACFTDGGALRSSEKTCHMDGDCTVAIHTVSCCGTVQYVGIAKSEAQNFAACEADRDAKLPKCGCPSQQPTTEDGMTAPFSQDAGAIYVSCVLPMNGAIGACTTSKH